MQINNFIDLLTMTWWWQISIFYFLFSIKCSPFSISTFEWVIDTVFILVFPIFNRLFNSSPPLTVFQLLEKHSVSMRSQFWLPKQHFFSPALSSFEFGLSWALFFLPSFFFTKLIILSKVCNTTFNEIYWFRRNVEHRFISLIDSPLDHELILSRRWRSHFAML